MITFKDIGYYGRLGNQIFQFAATFGLGKLKNYEVKFPIENILYPVNGYKCNLLDLFELEDYFDSFDQSNLLLYSEPSFEYNSLEHLSDNVTLHGYFQSEKYFQHCAEDLRNALAFKPKIVKQVELLDFVKDAISVHVRRGDYVSQPQNHPLQNIEFYEEGIQIINEDLPVAVFSDDTEWCRGKFESTSKNPVFIMEGGNPYTDFYLMSQCKHNIIANSSFSWWAAWLNQNADKKVIAPSNWFGTNIPHNTKDLIPDKWITL